MPEISISTFYTKGDNSGIEKKKKKFSKGDNSDPSNNMFSFESIVKIANMMRIVVRIIDN